MPEMLIAIWLIGWLIVFMGAALSEDLGIGFLCVYLGWLWPLAALVLGGMYLYFVYVHKTPS